MYLKRLNAKAKPLTKSARNAGFDLTVQLDEPYILQAGESKTFGTGIAVWLEDPCLAGLILPRSKLGSKYGIVIGNLTGVLDSSYQGELMINLWNRSKEAFKVADGMAVAQLVITKIPFAVNLVEVIGEFETESERGSKGINCKELRLRTKLPYEAGELA